MRRLKSFFLVLIALWLPLQAAAAVTMPFCRHAMETLAAEDTASSHPCHPMADEVATQPADVACDNCEMCHLATAGYLLATTEPVPPLSASILVPKLKSVSASHIPEPPQQPPRRLN